MAVIDEIAAERERQRAFEGYSDAHDDTHTAGELGAQAAAYAMSAVSETSDWLPTKYISAWIAKHVSPWGPCEFKPKTAREDLVRAGALIVAEIERLDRIKP